jgi:hypothetical protein
MLDGTRGKGQRWKRIVIELDRHQRIEADRLCDARRGRHGAPVRHRDASENPHSFANSTA